MKKQCLNCKKWFTQNINVHKFCSAKCRKILYFKNHPELRKKLTQAQWKYKRTKKGIITQSKYYRSEAHKEQSKRWRENPKNRIKILAHRIVNYAIKIGKLARQNCEICGKSNAFGHHDNYSKPLDVRWMCNFHHQEYHRQLF